MPLYLCKFHGRKRGAIGITYDITIRVDTDTPEDAEEMIREEYEVWGHIRFTTPGAVHEQEHS